MIMKEQMGHNWPWILTGIMVIMSVILFILIPDMTSRSQLGDYLSGFASTIAFIWLIAAYLQQRKELRLQREELAMQRTSLDLQREELKRLGKYAALEQVAHLLDQFDAAIRNNPENPVKTANDLPTAFMKGMVYWKVILESKDPQAVLDAYTPWMRIEGLCSEFLSRVVSAVELYCEATGENLLGIGTSPVERVYIGFEKLREIPFVRHYIGAAYSVASDMFLTEPGLDRLHLSGYEAIEKLTPGIVKAEALAELRAKVEAREASLKKTGNKNA
jgi:hypothetical protein